MAISVLSFHTIMCIYVLSNADAVASEIAKPNRSFLAWTYLGVLSVFRNDPELDLVQNGLPYDAIVANCRRRALMSLGISLVGIIVVAVFLLNGSLIAHF